MDIYIKDRSFQPPDPAVIYPGNTQSRHMKETGEKGCYLVNVCGGELSFEFKAVSDVLWETASIDISGTKQMTELISLMHDAFQSFRKKRQARMRQDGMDRRNTLLFGGRTGRHRGRDPDIFP